MLLGPALAQDARPSLDLGSSPWRAWRDEKAPYLDDPLHLPGQFKLSELPVNSPGCGWDTLHTTAGVVTRLPATIESLFGEGNPSWRYHGVSWFATEVEIPESWRGRILKLQVGKARLRLELYVNEQLAAYDIVAEPPLSVDITRFVAPGKKNRLAFRITNPGGQRGWNDAPCTEWGFLKPENGKVVGGDGTSASSKTTRKLPPGHDFGGITGEVRLEALEPVHSEELWVKNLLPAGARRIELRAEVRNQAGQPAQVEAHYEIRPWKGDHILTQGTLTLQLVPGSSGDLAKTLELPAASLWSPDSPALYTCRLRLKSRLPNGTVLLDETETRFGFRVIEAKVNARGEHHLYLNGERVRLRSAIDWGYYRAGGAFPTREQARRNIEAVKRVGHNSLNFHRKIGDPLVMEAADELGVLIYEEVGGMPGVTGIGVPGWIEGARDNEAYLVSQLMPAKFERMVRRDRKHPSVIAWNLGNEVCAFDYIHQRIFRETWALDNTRLLLNQSGGVWGGPSGWVPHFRPYEDQPRLDFVDNHTVDSDSRFQEGDLLSHREEPRDSLLYWGEVRCYTGPDNWVRLANEGPLGYDGAAYAKMAGLLSAYHARNRLAETSGGLIASPADITRLAATGLMYTNGRLSQAILSNNQQDGYAINGWSGADPELNDDFLGWVSALCDVDRNIKGDPDLLAYYNRDLQLAVFRTNGKYFRTGETALFEINLINENRLKPGEYRLRLNLLDGEGKPCLSMAPCAVNVLSGDTHAQQLIKACPVKMEATMRAGYLTLEATLLDSTGKVVANGSEQVLLQNRASWSARLARASIGVQDWDAATKALLEAQVSPRPLQEAKTLLLGKAPATKEQAAQWLKALERGATVVLRFDADWAALLHQLGYLSRPVTTWGGAQKRFWNGNGWGFLTAFQSTRDGAAPACVGTNSWEVPADPVGFAPFESKHPQTSRGVFVARPDQVLTLLGEIQCGPGRLLLAPSYAVDLDNAFSDLLFYSLVQPPTP